MPSSQAPCSGSFTVLLSGWGGWKLTTLRGKGQQGAHNPTKGLRASVRPPRSCQAGGEVVLMGIFRDPGLEQEWGPPPSWKAVSPVVGLPFFPAVGRARGPGQPAVSPLGELASPLSPLHSSVMTLHPLFLWWLGWQSSRSDRKQRSWG